MKISLSTAKTNSRHNSSVRRRILQGILLGFFLLFLLSFFDGFLGTLTSYITLPARNIKVWIMESSDTLPSYLRDRSTLLLKQRELEGEIAAGSGQATTIKLLVGENEHLRLLLGASTTNRVAAGVISLPSETPYDTLLIDRGMEDGIVEGALVFVRENVVVGFVSRVFKKSSLVVLVSTPGVKSTAYIYGPNIFTTAIGLGGGVIRVGVPQGIDMKVGNVVVVPSLSSGIFGVVTHIESSESSPEQYGFVTSPVPIHEIRYVAVDHSIISNIGYEEAQKIVEEMNPKLLTINVPKHILIVASSTPTTTEITR